MNDLDQDHVLKTLGIVRRKEKKFVLYSNASSTLILQNRKIEFIIKVRCIS